MVVIRQTKIIFTMNDNIFENFEDIKHCCIHITDRSFIRKTTTNRNIYLLYDLSEYIREKLGIDRRIDEVDYTYKYSFGEYYADVIDREYDTVFIKFKKEYKSEIRKLKIRKVLNNYK